MQLQQQYDDMTHYSSVAADSSSSLYYLNSSIERFTEEVIEQNYSSVAAYADTPTSLFVLTSSQKTLNACVPRIGGIITCVCALCMLIMAWKRRNRLFHRLVLGMSIHLLLKGIFSIIGMAAIPIGEINAIGNIGNITTCSIQGFVIYVCSMTSLFYYCSFSVYSFVGVLHNFEKEKYMWVEKYIHAIVHMYPIGSALYILKKQSFNAMTYGFCFIGNAPMGCVYSDDIPCERGPTTFGKLIHVYLFWMVPLVLELVFPTTVMMILYYKIKQRQDKIFMNVAIFKKQAIIYLFALYWTVLPFLLITLLHATAPDKKDTFFSLFAFAQLNISLFALWAMLSYFYFSFKRKLKNVPSSTTNTNATTTSVEYSTTNDVVPTTNTEQRKNKDFLFRSEEFIIEEPTTTTTTTDGIITTAAIPHEQQQRRLEIYSFNIFDGTNASSAFADFVHDGDSDDENYDQEITDHWSAVQDHI